MSVGINTPGKISAFENTNGTLVNIVALILFNFPIVFSNLYTTSLESRALTVYRAQKLRTNKLLSSMVWANEMILSHLMVIEIYTEKVLVKTT